MRDDRLVKYGIGHDGSDRKGSTSRPSGKQPKGDTVYQKEMKKKYGGKLPSAMQVVTDKIKEKYGKGAKVPAYKLGEEGYDRMRDDRLVKYGTGHDGSDRKGSTRYHSRPDTPEQKKRKQAASDEAYKSVVAKLKKKYGDGVMTSSKKIRKGKEVK